GSRQRLAQFGQAALIGDDRNFGGEFLCQRGQFLRLAIGGQRDHPPRFPVAPDQVERRSANRAGGAENGNGAGHEAKLLAMPNNIATGSNPSTLSNTPP